MWKKKKTRAAREGPRDNRLRGPGGPRGGLGGGMRGPPRGDMNCRNQDLRWAGALLKAVKYSSPVFRQQYKLAPTE